VTERGCRRLLALYPRGFRREHGDEMLAVVMAGADDGRWRPGPSEALDLVRSAVGMRLRAGTPAIRLMYLGALVELATLITIVASVGSVKSAMIARNPEHAAAYWHAEVHGRMMGLERSAAIAVGVWLWLAWANGSGRRWARPAFVVFFAVNTFGLLQGISRDAATYAPADMVAGGVLWLVLAAVLVLASALALHLDAAAARRWLAAAERPR
jgi:hypothetical protein